MRTALKRLWLVTLMSGLLLAAPLALTAQETPTEEADISTTDPAGMNTLVFLLGVGGIIFVGGRWLIHDSFQANNESES